MFTQSAWIQFINRKSTDAKNASQLGKQYYLENMHLQRKNSAILSQSLEETTEMTENSLYQDVEAQ